MVPDEDVPVREYRIAAMYRRSMWYVMATPWLTGGLTLALQLANGHDLQLSSAASFALVAALVSLLVGLVLRIRIRVDSRGISRRLFFGWRLWPWEDFLAGRMRFGSFRTTLQHVGSANPLDVLELGYLEDADSEEILAVVKRFWTPDSPPTDLEPSVTVITPRFLGWLPFRDALGRTEITFSPEGIVRRCRGAKRHYAWGDLHRIVVRRISHDHSDFRALSLELPDAKVLLTSSTGEGSAGLNYVGPEPRELLAYIRAHVPPSGVCDCSITGPILSEEERTERLAFLEKRQDDARRVINNWLMGMLLLIIPTLCVLRALAGEPYESAAFTIAFFPLVIVMCLFLCLPIEVLSLRARAKNVKRQCAELKAMPLQKSPETEG